MTKEDKQTIDRATKENWRIFDRTRLKHLLEKNLTQYRENVELENKIADIKANCDLAIEGRDIKIKELEEENNKLLDVINNQDVKIADLEKENEELKAKLNFSTQYYLGEKAKDQLAKAKEIIQNIIRITWGEGWSYSLDWKVKAEQFLNEVEK